MRKRKTHPENCANTLSAIPILCQLFLRFFKRGKKRRIQAGEKRRGFCVFVMVVSWGLVSIRGGIVSSVYRTPSGEGMLCVH